MATIGLDSVYYSKITEDARGIETYAVPKYLAPAITAELSIENAEAKLYADDRLEDFIGEFSGGSITMGFSDISAEVLKDLFGVMIDGNGVVTSTAEDESSPVAIGFRSKTSKKKYRYVWLFRVMFAVPSSGFETKNDGITFKTPEIEGAITARNKPLYNGKRPWKSEVTEGATGVSTAAIKDWFKQVYEPDPIGPQQ